MSHDLLVQMANTGIKETEPSVRFTEVSVL